MRIDAARHHARNRQVISASSQSQILACIVRLTRIMRPRLFRHVSKRRAETHLCDHLVRAGTKLEDRSGRVIERKAGRKHIAIRSLPTGGTFEQQVPPAQVHQLCLDDVQLAALGELALRCEKVYGPRRDIEWAFQGGTLYLLQCRAVTTGKAGSAAPPPGPPPHDPLAA